ncbi:MAG: hypothetical protein LUE14_04045 [Clostridiales bacterium]|nr:hypothetical protein [Clostridiales bacterium]
MSWKEDLKTYKTPMGNEYEMMRHDKNNMSYWLPKLEGNVKELSLPKTTIIQIPDRICDCFWAYDGPFAETFEDDVYGFVKE